MHQNYSPNQLARCQEINRQVKQSEARQRQYYRNELIRPEIPIRPDLPIRPAQSPATWAQRLIAARRLVIQYTRSIPRLLLRSSLINK